MPISIRRLYSKKISDEIEKHNEAIEAGKSGNGSSNTFSMDDMINKTGAVAELRKDKPDYIAAARNSR